MSTKFEAGNKYRGKAVEWMLQKIPTTGTVVVSVMIEVTLGALIGRRMRWQGYATEDAIERTVEELRAMGLRAQEFGRWDGMGSTEFEFTALQDVKGQKSYWRAAFCNPLAQLSDRNPVDEGELVALSRKFQRQLARPDAPPRTPRPANASAPPQGRFDDDDDFTAPPIDDAAATADEIPFG